MGVYAKSPYCMGAKIWHNLPLHIMNLNAKNTFKYELQMYLRTIDNKLFNIG